MKFFYLFLLLSIQIIVFSQKQENYITIYRNKSSCIIDVNNKELIPSGRYSNIWTSYDYPKRYFVVTNFNNKKGIYDLGVKETIPCIYDDINMFGNYGFFKKENKWALVSRQFKLLTDFVFDESGHFRNDGKSLLKINNNWKLIDTLGNEIKSISFDKAFAFNEDETYKKAGRNNKYGYVDREYNIVIPFEYENVADAVSGANDLLPAKKNNKWGFVNKNNEDLIDFKYDYLSPIYKGFSWIRDKNFRDIGIINEKGKVLFDDGRYFGIEYTYEGTLKFTTKNPKTGKYLQGYIDSTNFEVLIKPEFDFCDNFNNGLAIVKKNDFMAIVNKSGKIVVPYKYQFVSRWGDKYIVSLNGKSGLINRNGDILTPLVYDSFILGIGGGGVIIVKKELQGVLNYNGKELIAPKYNQIKSITNDIFYAEQNGKKYFININGTKKEIE